MHCVEDEQPSAIKAISYELFQGISPQAFQEELRRDHRIIADNNLPLVTCDRRGLMTLNSLKEFVIIEGAPLLFLPFLKRKVKVMLNY
jgi:hypothetical protein